MAPPAEPAPRSPRLPIRWVAAAALAIALLHLALVLAGSAAASWRSLQILRLVLSTLVLCIPGLPFAVLAVTARRTTGGHFAIGGFALAACSLGASLVVYYGVAVTARWFAPPVTGGLYSVTAVIGACGALVLLWRKRELGVHLEPGLSPLPLGLALALVIGFGVAARDRLFLPLDAVVKVSPRYLSTLLHQRPWHAPPPQQLTAVQGARPAGDPWYEATQPRVLFKLSTPDTPRRWKLVAFAVSAPVGARIDLQQVEDARCGLAATQRSARRLASTRVPEEVLGFSVHHVLARFNAVVIGQLEPGVTEACLALEVDPGGRAAGGSLDQVELAPVGHEIVTRSQRIGGRLYVTPAHTVEALLSNAHYRMRMQRSNAIDPSMLLWGYFTAFVVERLAGQWQAPLGGLFLLCCLMSFAGALVLLGAAEPQPPPRTPRGGLHQHIPGLVLLVPLFAQLYSLTFNPYFSFTFPDGPYTVFILGAVALLVRRDRGGFILLGCLGAYARYPGAYVLAVALVARLVLFRDDRAWTRRTLLWSMAAGLSFVALLLLHFQLTTSIGHWIRTVYFEVYPEHFVLPRSPYPAWCRITCFFVLLGAFSSFAVLLWPFVRDATGKLLIVVTAAYAVTLMAVHVPHLHYFPLLAYCAAAAGLRAAALRERIWLSSAAAALAGLAVALVLQSATLAARCTQWICGQ